MDSPSSAAPSMFPLRGRAGVVTLEAEGLHHPSGARRGGTVYSAYADITHLSTSSRALWLGTRRSVYVIGRSQFVDPNAPENLVRALLERIAARPDGSRQLARMAQIEETVRNPGALYATWGLAIACAATYVVQWVLGERVHAVGYFTGALALDGDWWRGVTANLLHGFLIHLVLNLLGLLALGSLVERTLGTARTVCVMAASAAAAMAASGVATPFPVVGVSGVVFGLLGALVWLELRFADVLPAWWRIPRRGFYWMIILSAGLSFLPFIAGAAHLGGFLGGGAAAAGLAWSSLGPRGPSPVWVRGVAGAALAVAVAAVGMAGYVLARPGEYVAYHAERLYRLADATPDEMNNLAWIIAIDPDASREHLELALRLAERAVEESDHEAPHILDTLAEVHFQLGDRDAALAAIEEAIHQNPANDYYREQKRRFLGEREPEDRPFYDPGQDAAPGANGEPGLSV